MGRISRHERDPGLHLTDSSSPHEHIQHDDLLGAAVVSATSSDIDISRDDIHDELQRILKSNSFRKSDGLQRLLSFLILKLVSGENTKLKEYLLGVEVFGRRTNFDPRVDAIVRVQATRLRAKLAEYYQSEGYRNPFIIELPKGHYIASVRRRDTSKAHPGCSEQSSLMTVIPFLNLVTSKGGQYFADALTEDIIDRLVKLPHLRVTPRVIALHLTKTFAANMTEQVHLEYILEGSVRKLDGILAVKVRLFDSSYKCLWYEHYTEEAGNLAAAQEALCSLIVNGLESNIGSQDTRLALDSAKSI